MRMYWIIQKNVSMPFEYWFCMFTIWHIVVCVWREREREREHADVHTILRFREIRNREGVGERKCCSEQKGE